MKKQNNQRMPNCKSFNPVINKNSKILILGSMPGIKSLEEQQYYAHPQNRFWKLMGRFCDCCNLQDLNYEERLQTLLNNNFALWDVINFCNREGSLDTNIQNEVPNKILILLKKYKNIKTIILNGNKAYSAFKKYFPELLKEYKCYKMPSTSPANARYSLEKLDNEWSNFKN
jgi:hypoxanthine-DNA glycosylase